MKDLLSQQLEMTTFKKYYINEMLKLFMKYREIISEFFKNNPKIFEQKKSDNFHLDQTKQLLFSKREMIENLKKENLELKDRIFNLKDQNSDLTSKFTSTNEEMRIVQDKILIYYKRIQELIEGFFQNKNDYYIKTLEIKLNCSNSQLRNLIEEKESIKEFYENRILQKDQEIQLLSDNYKKKLYENFHSKPKIPEQNINNNNSTSYYSKNILDKYEKTPSIPTRNDAEEKEAGKKKATKKNQKKNNKDILTSSIFNLSNF